MRPTLVLCCLVIGLSSRSAVRVSVSGDVKLSAIPDSVRNHMGFFEKHGLRHVFFIASDVQQNSMNVYFGMDEDCRREGWIRRLAEDTGGTLTHNANKAK